MISPPRTRHAPVRAESTYPLLVRAAVQPSAPAGAAPPREAPFAALDRGRGAGGTLVAGTAGAGPPAEEGIGDLQSPVASVGEYAARRPGRLADRAAVPALIDQVKVYRAALSGGEIAGQYRPAQDK